MWWFIDVHKSLRPQSYKRVISMCIYIYIYHTSTIKTCLEIEIAWNLRGTSRAPEEGTRKQQSATTSMQLSANLAEPMPGGRTCPETRPDSLTVVLGVLIFQGLHVRGRQQQLPRQSLEFGKAAKCSLNHWNVKLIDKRSWFAKCRKCGTSLKM